jgi:hypothetical protein
VHGDSPLNCIIWGPGEQGHHPIAIILINKPMVFFDYRTDPLQIGIDKIEIFPWRHAFGQRGPPAYIGEHHCHFLLYLVAQPNFQYALFPQ